MTTGAKLRVRYMPLWLGWTLAVVVAVAFAALGRWQLQRAHHKDVLLAQTAQVLARRQALPLSAAGAPDGLHWSTGRGQFTDAPALLLDNQMHQGRAGVRIYRVFQPVDASPLLVELGWQPLPADRRLPQIPKPAQTIVSGLLMPPPAAGLAGHRAPVRQGGVWLALGLQPQALAGALHAPDLAPRVLRLDPRLPWGYPRDLDVLPNTLPPARHLGYAVQWFGLALAVLVTAAVLTFRRGRAARAKISR
ncbi:MAG: SURF1 family protein [Pseudoxanthomonas sp.]